MYKTINVIIAVIMFFCFNVISANNNVDGSSNSLESINYAIKESTSEIKELFNYVENDYVNHTHLLNKNTERYVITDSIKNYSVYVEDKKYDRIEFFYCGKNLLFYTVCCSDELDIINKLNESINGFYSKEYSNSEYHIWKDGELILIFDVFNKYLTIGVDKPVFFDDVLHGLANYSPFIKNGNLNNLYQSISLERFYFLSKNYNSYKKHISSEKEIGNLKYCLIDNIKNAVFVEKNILIDRDNNLVSSMEIMNNDMSVDKSIDIIDIKVDLEILFYKDSIMSYNMFFENNEKSEVIYEEFIRRYGQPNKSPSGTPIKVWGINDIVVVITSELSDDVGVIVTIYNKELLNKARKDCIRNNDKDVVFSQSKYN